ncbi:MAG: cbb3-type cytochrome c oxidase N-terminal domain-containing protein [Myxococcota bacterium]
MAEQDKTELRVDPIQGEIIHVYDGIEEADNELPRWWLLTFYGAMAFAMFYWVTYHELEAAALPAEEYATALMERSSGAEASEELLVALRDDPAAVAVGEALFQEHCSVCHLERGQGNIGPNLTDPNWLHGGSPTDIYGTIYEGVLEAGMPAWGATLGSTSAQKIAAFVLSIQNSNVEGKAPEGDVWSPAAAPTEEDGDGTTAQAPLRQESAGEPIILAENDR